MKPESNFDLIDRYYHELQIIATIASKFATHDTSTTRLLSLTPDEKKFYEDNIRQQDSIQHENFQRYFLHFLSVKTEAMGTAYESLLKNIEHNKSSAISIEREEQERARAERLGFVPASGLSEFAVAAQARPRQQPEERAEREPRGAAAPSPNTRAASAFRQQVEKNLDTNKFH